MGWGNVMVTPNIAHIFQTGFALTVAGGLLDSFKGIASGAILLITSAVMSIYFEAIFK